MLTIRVEGYEIDLTPLKDVLISTGVNQSVLDKLSAEDLDDHPIWHDFSLQETVAKRLVMSIPDKISVSHLPTLPDQLALLLRSELTLMADKYPLESEEKDEAEQLLQNLIRPLIYHLIDRHYAEKPPLNRKRLCVKRLAKQSQQAGDQLQVINGKFDLLAL